MDELIDISIENLENIVSVAPYSQYHQMLLALKKGKQHEANLQQVQAGGMYRVLSKQGEAVEKYFEDTGLALNAVEANTIISLKHINKEPKKIKKKEKSSILNITPTIPKLDNFDPIDKKTEETKPKSEKKKEKKEKSNVLNITPTIPKLENLDPIDRKTEEKKPKTEKKKKKKEGKKKKNEAIDSDLSDFTKWLIAKGYSSGVSELKNKKTKSQKTKHKKKSKKSKKTSKEQVKSKEVISEPLAQLFADQGHIDKAIEMYNKLSLIFPEKSTFFASQIENLKNKE